MENLEAEQLLQEQNLETTLNQRRTVYEELLQSDELGEVASKFTDSAERPKSKLALARRPADTARHPDPIAEGFLHFLSTADLKRQLLLEQTTQTGGTSLKGVSAAEVPFMLLSAFYVTLNRGILPALSHLDTSLRQQSAQIRLWKESLGDQKSRVDSSLKNVSDRLSQTTLAYEELERQFEESSAGANVFPEFKPVTLSGLVVQLELSVDRKSKAGIRRFLEIQDQVSDELRKSRPPNFDASRFQSQVLPLLEKLGRTTSELNM